MVKKSMLIRGQSTLIDVVDDFVASLDGQKMDLFMRYIPNRMWIQVLDFYDYLISRYDFYNSGAWIAELISENDPVGATLCQKFSSNGQNTFEWEAGVIIDLAKEKLGITFEWQREKYGNPSDSF